MFLSTVPKATYNMFVERSKFAATVVALSFLALCVAVFVIKTWHWSLISDAVLMHYVIFLMRNGLAPYRDIIDINMPGTYLLDMGVLGLFGETAKGWRIFDFTLLTFGSAAMLIIARPYSAMGGAVAAALFTLLHGADGVAQAGERDFTVAVMLLAGCAGLLHGFRQIGSPTKRCLGLFLWGLFAGAAATIKPPFLLTGGIVILLSVVVCIRRHYEWPAPLAAGILGMALPFAAVVLFLVREHAVWAFYNRILPLVFYHASMGRHSMGFLLGHVIPPKVMPLLIVAAIGAFRTRPFRTIACSRWEGSVLGACAAVGLLSFVAQGKAYSYHRAPLIAFALCLAMVQLVCDVRRAKSGMRAVSLLALLYAIFWLAPASAVKAIRWNCDEPSLAQLASDLSAFKAANGSVQCMDTTAGCITVLSRLQLVQDTGFLYDCYFFAPGASKTREVERQHFLQAIDQAPDALYVVTDQWCFNLPSGYSRLDRWQAFDDLLASDYELVVSRPAPIASRRDLAAGPFAYRICRRR